MVDESIAKTTEVANDEIHARFYLDFFQSGKKPFVLDVNIVVPGRGITAIFGESGSGKTSLLRCIAGLEKDAMGRLSINGQSWQSDSEFIPTHKRSLGYVFQEASLFEHLSVLGNLRYAIKRSRTIVKPELFEEVLQIMGIDNLLSHKPAHLSGGERQRVAIARALLSQPKLLLMDEPLASLDTARKQEILPYLERLRSKVNIPILYVSHALEEIVQLADHAVIMQQGKVCAQGKATTLFSRTDLPLGADNEQGAIIDCKVVKTDEQWQLMQVAFDGSSLWLPKVNTSNNETRRIRILASDVSLTLTQPTDTSILNVLAAKIIKIVEQPDKATCLVSLVVGNSCLLARVTKKSCHNLALHADKIVWVQIKSAAFVR